MKASSKALVVFALLALVGWSWMAGADSSQIGKEVSVPRHLNDGQEYQISVQALISHGARLFSAIWTSEEGGGRPLTKGTGSPVADATSPLTFPRNFN
ncbi:MAG TPA: hypothetical protein PK413_21575, partial [Thermoanaerobaculia bacterium]|nr:hypothetical protein [Thermoanaerobaculia bacterium]